jgi:hypothetical protein
VSEGRGVGSNHVNQAKQKNKANKSKKGGRFESYPKHSAASYPKKNELKTLT